ncbi:RING and CHY zinc finger domain-containing protein [Spironucleus salmonicida]|uniref:RING and CHY zinc finger domain-containing protein n=1 Tax=Spironucleus salmonicida TaxID=348837 RepID=V6LP10_9EUKA|nr:RING and CHY zinc finger domain-containing protein [Spironucleus salmonicida]|eukprot:EST46412.1 RING and CHY zinc finger domain-containing protein [Spironucleus salmonicida]
MGQDISNSDDNCPICLELLEENVYQLPCTHKIHRDCFQDLVINGSIQCPICRQSFMNSQNLLVAVQSQSVKSIREQVAQSILQQMPAEEIEENGGREKVLQDLLSEQDD